MPGSGSSIRRGATERAVRFDAGQQRAQPSGQHSEDAVQLPGGEQATERFGHSTGECDRLFLRHARLVGESAYEGCTIVVGGHVGRHPAFVECPAQQFGKLCGQVGRGGNLDLVTDRVQPRTDRPVHEGLVVGPQLVTYGAQPLPCGVNRRREWIVMVGHGSAPRQG